MIGQTLSLVSALFDAVGPGLFLAAALPISLVALGLVARAGREKTKNAE